MSPWRNVKLALLGVTARYPLIGRTVIGAHPPSGGQGMEGAEGAVRESFRDFTWDPGVARMLVKKLSNVIEAVSSPYLTVLA